MFSKVFTSLITLSVLLSCGKSPFLNEKKPDKSISFNQALTDRIYLKKTQIEIKTQWATSPEVGEESKLMVMLIDKFDNLITNEQVELRAHLWMPNMNHGSFPIKIKRLSGGVFYLTDIFFTMPGVWNFHFEIKNQTDQIQDATTWPLNI